jgi:hypothetical protein
MKTHTEPTEKEIRETLSRFVHNFNWEVNRGVMPYDSRTYLFPELVKLCELLKVDFADAHLLKQDKRGAWR